MTGATPSATTARRKRRLALAFVVLGMTTVLARQTLPDIVYGLLRTDGIYIPDATYQIPSQMEGEVSHTFRIYNLRSQPLKVTAEPDCGCTGVSWKSATIAAFGWKDLTARMSVRKGNSQSVSIAIRTDSRDKPWLFAFMQTKH